ncbi:MAG: hypothetical protein RMK29_05300 [Myxococcales bacterium]|nr:hypothetical protein [Myxococcota bacterium]MDW8281107.1 hypothetical protein [Myxococcales bacterium]
MLRPRSRAATLQVADPERFPEVVEAARHIARLIRRERLAVLGFCPASDAAAVLPAAAQVGVALAEQSGSPVALIDINARWSALPPPPDAPTLEGSGLLRTRWLSSDKLALLSLPPQASIGAGLVEMARILRSGRTMFEQLLVDMTGLDRLGEHLSAAAMCDALVFVARALKTTEQDLERLQRDFATCRCLGVILTGV